jgi:hypothetical protein
MVTVPSKPTRPSNTYLRDQHSLAKARTLCHARSHVLISLDIKWLENEEDTILEIGLATLDLRPGFLRPARYPPSTWAIRPRHFIISENRNVFNQRGTGKKFGFKFGKSYICRLAKAIAAINETFANYPSEQVALVGQFIHRDLKIFRELGVEIPETWPVFDVASLDRADGGEVNSRRRGLGVICEELEVNHYREDKMGNGGNDVWFAMAAFAAMCT